MNDNVVDIQLKLTADYSDVDKNITALKEQLITAFSDFDKAMSKTNNSKLKQSISAGQERIKQLNDELIKYEQLKDKAQQAADVVNQMQGQRLRSAKKDSGVSPEQYQRLTDALTRAKAESWKMNDAFLAQKETVNGLVSEILKVTNAAYFIARKTGDKMGYGKEPDDNAPPKDLKEKYEAISDVLSEWDEKIKATNGDMKAMSQLAVDIARSLTGRPGASDELKQFIKMRYAELTAANETANAQDGVTNSVKKTSKAMKEVLTAEQASAKESLKNARQKASANYYVLRAAKMLQKQVNELWGTIVKFDKSLVSLSARGLRAIAKLALGFKSLHKAANKATSSHNGFTGSLKIGFRTVLKYTFGIRSLYFLVNKLRKALGDSMGVLAQSSSLVNEQMSSLLSNVSWMKNMLATVAQPILNVLVPALNYLAQVFDRVTYAIASFFATLTGQSFVYKATKNMENYAASLDKAGSSAKKLNNNLIGLDELNVINNDSGGSGSGSGGAGDFGMAEVEPAASEMAKKVKDIISTLFDPILDAWKSKGKFVMDSWKYALKEVKALIGTIGRDFLEVWANDTGVKIWEDIFQIVGDVGLIVGHLARNFTDAWNSLDVGKHILEQIQTIIYRVIDGIRQCADATVEWADELNFKPLLYAVHNLLVALQKPIQTIVDILVYLWTNVILPFRKYMIEEGLPKLLSTIGKITKAIDWDLLESRMKKLMDAFEPFLEKVWETFLIVLQDIGDALADIVNSDGFGYIVDKLVEWMNNASPEEMAKKVESFAKALAVLTVTLTGLKVGLEISTQWLTFKNVFLQNDVLKATKDLTRAMGGGEAGNVGLFASLKSLPEAFTGFMQNMDLVNPQLLATGGTVAGLASTIGGSVISISSFMEMFTEGFSAGNEILMLFGIALTTVGAILLGAPAAIAVAVGAVVAAVANILIAIQTMPEEFGNKINEVGEAIGKLPELMEHWFDVAIEKIREFGHNLGVKVGELVRKAVDGFKDFPENFKKWAKTVNWSELGLNILKGILYIFLLPARLLKFTLEAVGNFFAAFVEGIKEGFGIHSPAATMKPYGEYILLGILEGIVNAISGIGDWIKTNIADPIINGIKTALSADTLKTIGTNLINGIKNGLSNAWSAISTIFTELVTKISEVIGTIVTTVSNIFTTMGTTISTVITELSTTLSTIFTTLGTTLSAIITAMKDNISSIFTAIVTSVVTIVTTMKTTVTNIFNLWKSGLVKIVTAIKTLISGDFTSLKDVVVEIFTTMKDTVLGIFNELSDGIKTVVNTIITLVESFANGVIKGINAVIDALNSLQIDVPDWVTELTGITSFGFDIPKLSEISIPRLAQGAVIPPNNEFLAVLGDQTSGTNIEAPLSTIQDAVALVLQPYLEQLISITQDIYEKDTDLYIGDVEIARANNRGQRRLGATLRKS